MMIFKSDFIRKWNDELFQNAMTANPNKIGDWLRDSTGSTGIVVEVWETHVECFCSPDMKMGGAYWNFRRYTPSRSERKRVETEYALWRLSQ